MDAAQTLSNPDSFSIINVFLRADWVVKLDLVVLALASVWSWAIIIEKLFRFGALNSQADAFERDVNSGRTLEEVAGQAGEHPHSAMGRMLNAALRDYEVAV